MSCKLSAGKIRLKIWERADSANTIQYITFQYDLTSAANCVATSISEATKSSIRIFPNPVKDKLNINGLSEIENLRIEVYNLIGSKVFSKTTDNANAESAVINTDFLGNGIYFAKLFSGDNLIVTKKFTKE